jgi:hypothetical protein
MSDFNADDQMFAADAPRTVFSIPMDNMDEFKARIGKLSKRAQRIAGHAIEITTGPVFMKKIGKIEYPLIRQNPSGHKYPQ